MRNTPIKDQMGFEVTLESLPRRIVSLVPSQTELLFDLGLEDRIVGVTKFCVHPAHARKTKTIIGGTKKFDLERIVALKPDLVIGNKEENYEEGITFLRERFPVWMSDIVELSDALEMIDALGRLTGKHDKGTALIDGIRSRFQLLKKPQALRTLYLMWHEPWMGAASDTFIDTMMRQAGMRNVLDQRKRYPELSERDIVSLNPDLVLLSSEPFPFSERHLTELRRLIPFARILQVDGEMFSWYGSRLLLAPGYFRHLLEKLD